VLLFKNDFTIVHWVGSILVFLGTIFYSWPKEKVGKQKTG
jgi:drug/metabolite transporter (DMT)-like permease